MDIQERENFDDYKHKPNKYDMLERRNLDIPDDIDAYTEPYSTDTRRFLYSNLYLKTKRRVKRSYKVVAFVKNAVQNEYTITVTNERKLFFEVNTSIVKYYYKKIKTHPFTEVGRLKKKILFESNETLYLTHNLLAFRTLTFKMLTKQIQIINFTTFARYLNKIMFFNLIHNFKAISFKKGPLLIRYKYKKRKRIRLVSAIGYRLRIRTIKLKSLSTRRKRLIPTKKYKRKLRRKRKKLLKPWRKALRFKQNKRAPRRLNFLRIYNKQLLKYYKKSIFNTQLTRTINIFIKKILYKVNLAAIADLKKIFYTKRKIKRTWKFRTYKKKAYKILNKKRIKKNRRRLFMCRQKFKIYCRRKIQKTRKHRKIIMRKGGTFLRKKFNRYRNKEDFRHLKIINDNVEINKYNIIFHKFSSYSLNNYRKRKLRYRLFNVKKYSKRRNYIYSRTYRVRTNRYKRINRIKYHRIQRLKEYLGNSRYNKMKKRRYYTYKILQYLAAKKMKKPGYSTILYSRNKKFKSLRYKKYNNKRRSYKVKQKLKYSFRNIILPQKREHLFKRLNTKSITKTHDRLWLSSIFLKRSQGKAALYKRKKKKHARFLRKRLLSRRKKYLKFLQRFQKRSRRMAKTSKRNFLGKMIRVNKPQKLSLRVNRHLKYYIYSRINAINLYSRVFYRALFRKIPLFWKSVPFILPDILCKELHDYIIFRKNKSDYFNRYMNRAWIQRKHKRIRFSYRKYLYYKSRFFKNKKRIAIARKFAKICAHKGESGEKLFAIILNFAFGKIRHNQPFYRMRKGNIVIFLYNTTYQKQTFPRFFSRHSKRYFKHKKKC